MTSAGQARWPGISRGLAGAVVVAVVAIVAVALASGGSGKGSSSSAVTSVGAPAPEGSFTTTSGTTRTVASLSGQPTLLWFVTTWCSSCQAGTQAMASQIGKLTARHVRVVELELAEDLGQAGPTITAFGRQLAGAAYNNPNWTFGTASSALTKTYDPEGALDIYYLLNAGRRIAYINSSPAATIGQLLNEAEKVGSNA